MRTPFAGRYPSASTTSWTGPASPAAVPSLPRPNRMQEGERHRDKKIRTRLRECMTGAIS